MTDILTIEEAGALLKAKKISAFELLKQFKGAIDKKEQNTKAYLEVYSDDALLRAEETDRKIAKGWETGVLEGMPIAVKDNMLTCGKITSAGSKILKNYTSSYDAHVISKINKEGSNIIGRTNMDEFAMGSSCENSAYFPTLNPHDFKRVPGGSSGGSAAAVASGECIAALGSDTGGSIRQPAAFCGVVGLKPTYGAVSRSGLIAMASSLDQIGPITRTVKDAEILFDVIKGKDPLDSTSCDIKARYFSNKPLVVGIPEEYFGEGVDEEVKKLVESEISKFKDVGYEVKKINLPHTPYALPAYYIIMPAEASSNLARFDGMRYGLREDTDNLYNTYSKSRAEGFGREVRRRVILGTYVLSSGYYDAYYLKAQKVRALIKKDFDEAFKDVDIIASPTTPTTAFKIGEKTQDPLEMYASDILTVPANLTGLPAISIPCGKIGKLPVGMQFIGKPFGETILFEAGKKYEILRDS